MVAMQQRTSRRPLAFFAALAAAGVASALFSAAASAFAGPLAAPRAAGGGSVALAAELRSDANLGGDFWAHPWAEELAASPKGDDMVIDDVVEHFNSKREAEGLDLLEEGSSPLVILEGIVTNSALSGQPGMNKAQRIADGIQASSFLLSELTE